MEKKYVFVGCSSSKKVNDIRFINSAINIAKTLTSYDYNLVFGACNDGLMGEVYRTMKANNSSVIGVAPTIYKDDFKYLQCDQEYAVDTTNERIRLMIDKSDILLFLAGGTGTLEELIVSIELKRRKEIDKPIIIYDENGFYLPLINQFKNMYENNFSDKLYLFDYITNIEDLDYLLSNLNFKEKEKIR